MMHNKRLGLVTALFISMFYVACDDLDEIGKIDDIAIEAEYALPIINTSLSIADLFEEDGERTSFLDIDQNGDMTILFDTDGPSENFSDILSIPAQIPLQATASGYKVNMQPGGPFTINSITLKGGTLDFQVTSSMEEDVDVTVMIPELQNGGSMFSTGIQLNYAGGMMTENIGPISLSDYEIDLSTDEITIMYEATSSSGSVELDAVTGMASNWEFSLLKGEWTNEAIDLAQEQIDIDIYKNWEAGALSFADPLIRLDVTSNIGFPTGMAFDVVSGTTVDDQNIALSGSIVGAENTLNFPSISEIGTSKTTSIDINTSNSNIDEFFTSQLSVVDLQLGIATNTGSPTYEGFITDDAIISTALHVELPVFGTASGFTLSNAFDADLTNVDNIRSAEITVEIDNGLPLELDVQLYFIDGNGAIVDSLFNQTSRLVESAQVDGSGEVTASTMNLLVQEISEQRAAQIFTKTKMIDVKGIVSTANEGNTDVRLNTNQAMAINLSAKVKIKD